MQVRTRTRDHRQLIRWIGLANQKQAGATCARVTDAELRIGKAFGDVARSYARACPHSRSEQEITRPPLCRKRRADRKHLPFVVGRFVVHARQEVRRRNAGGSR